VVDHRIETFEDFIRSLLPGGTREIKDFSDRGLNHFVPWTSLFDIYRTDYVMRMENLDSDIKRVAERIGIGASLEKQNVSRKSRDYKLYYTLETRQIVTELYKKDLEVFGYQF
jgi:hypothetical protein